MTTHVEAIVASTDDAYAFGRALSATTKQLRFGEVLRASTSELTVWHSHRNVELLLGIALKWVLRRKLLLVHTRHGGSRPGFYSRLLLRAAQRVVVLNPTQQAQLPDGAAVVSHGIDLTRFCPPDGGREAARARIPLSARFALGVVGRLRKDKGQADFIDALAGLAPLPSGTAVLLVGRVQPQDRAWAARLAARLPAAQFVPEQEDPLPYLQALDLCVQPSHGETFSYVVAEAMACGCAVVAAALPGASAAIEHGRTGFLYPPGNVEALRDLLRHLLANPELVATVGAAAAAAAREHFDVRREARDLRALYAQEAS